MADDGLHGDIEGYIIPPPELRTIVDKTAQFVGKNGKSFEARIRANEQGNLKFNFLKEDDPYHAYYLAKVKEAEDAKNGIVKKESDGDAAAKAAKEEQDAEAQAAAEAEEASKGESQDGNSISKEAEHSRVGLIAKLAKDLSQDPPPPDSFTLVKPRLTPQELDTIKLTARFTAVSGREFLSGLAQRELSNPEFDFLKPTHMLFGFFTSLVDSYSKCLKPPKELKTKLGDTLTSRNKVLQRCVHRLRWDRKEEQEKQERESQASADKVAYQSIDWHDFVVVETITFDDDDEALPVPQALEDSSAARPTKVSANIRTKTSAEDQAATKRARLTAAADDDDEEKIVVRTDYKGAAATAAGGARAAAPKFFIDPRTGRHIPIAESEEHMRIELLDPKWKEQQKRALDTQATSQFASDDQIAANLSSLGRARPDIFGGDELEARKKKQEADKAAARVIWDGHTASVQEVQMKALEKQREELQRRGNQPRQPEKPAIGPAIPSNVQQRQPPPPPQPSATSSGAPAGSAKFMPPTSAAVPQMNMLPPPPGPGLVGHPPGMHMAPPTGPPPPHAFPAPIAPPPPRAPPPAKAAPPPPPAKPVRGGTGAALAQAEALTSEADFLAAHPGSFSLRIAVPAEFGPAITVQVPYSSRISDVKEKLVPLLAASGLKQNKMQLKHPTHGFMKDSLSLAHYNVDGSAQVLLVPKVRGR
eukprot:INCI11124.1.p1 GENE.INCI11124.1~~INCI11124.1.p1  ORF type:complete len:704 (+),score=163.94 INCI11124.1:239-2350(+)